VMGEHSSLEDRLSWITNTVGEPDSKWVIERAEKLINSFSESGYHRYLQCLVAMRDARLDYLWSGIDPSEADLALWADVPRKARAILLAIARHVAGDWLTDEQQALLNSLQEEQIIEPDPDLDLHDRRLLAELWEARALDECTRQRQVPAPQRQSGAKEKIPPELEGTGYEHDRRRWPKTQAIGEHN